MRAQEKEEEIQRLRVAMREGMVIETFIGVNMYPFQ